MVQKVLNDDRKDPLDHVQMLFPPHGPEGEERSHGRVEVVEVRGKLLGAGRDVQPGILKSDGNPRHNLHHHHHHYLLSIRRLECSYLGLTGDGRTCVCGRGTDQAGAGDGDGGLSIRNSSHSCSGGWRPLGRGPPLPPPARP